MSKLMRFALENEEAASAETAPTVVMQGPLSEVYTQALHVAYAKPDPISAQPALESQANDALTQAAAIQSLLADNRLTPPKPGTTIYGVSEKAVTDQVVIDVVEKLTKLEVPQEDNFILVIDATEMSKTPDELSGERNDYINPAADADAKRAQALTPVLEALAVKYGVRVCRSLSEAYTAR